MADETKKLYDNLIKSGRVTSKELGDYDSFHSKMDNQYENVAKLYNNLRKDDLFSIDEIGDYKSFAKNVSGSFSSTETPGDTKETTTPADSLRGKPGFHGINPRDVSEDKRSDAGLVQEQTSRLGKSIKRGFKGMAGSIYSGINRVYCGQAKQKGYRWNIFR
jgi:hypothetical protein